MSETGPNWTCRVNRVGLDQGGEPFIQLTHVDGAFQKQFYLFGSVPTKEILAIALSALTSGKRVVARLPVPVPPPGPVSTCEGLFLLED